MNRIDAQFARLSDLGQAAFIPFLTAGDPSLRATLRVLQAAEKAGAALIELGFPFSDPVADGPTIQASYTRVLGRGQRAAEVFDLVRAARQACRLPIVAMVSYSIVFRMGFEAFVDRALSCGIDGATIPDLPIEEAEPLFAMAEERDFRLICFATPATTKERRRLIVNHARGFIYYISVRGITGARAELPADLVDHIGELKADTRVPIAVGFGISEPEHAEAVARVADGVIVGSAIVRRMAGAVEEGTDAADAALSFIRKMAAATRNAR
jgi:tryptophan synthase alpha chain